MKNAEETWRYIEHLLTEECGLHPDEGLGQQRSNCINAIVNGQKELRDAAAAVQEEVCGALCPSVWKTVEGRPPHHPKCEALQKALAGI